MKRIVPFLLLACLFFAPLTIKGQSFVDKKEQYPIASDNGKSIVSGFVPFAGVSDETIFANAMLWAVENICTKNRDGLFDINIEQKKFSANLELSSLPELEQNSLYYCKLNLRVAEGKLVFYVSDIMIESSILMIKKTTPLEKLNPEKKAAHKEAIDAYVQTISAVLNQLFDFVNKNNPGTISHWKKITYSTPIKGMTENECRLAFGKPQSVRDMGDEVQWMYSSSFYLFFKNGRVSTIIK